MNLIRQPWNGKDATTGLTAAQMRDAAKASAISICRAYGISGMCDPAYIANIIQNALDRERIVG